MILYSNVYEINKVSHTKNIALPYFISELLCFDKFFSHYPYAHLNLVTIWNFLMKFIAMYVRSRRCVS